MQARTCYTRYNEFYKCKALKDEDDPECKMHQRAYRTLCPGDWVDKWNEQREEGTWCGCPTTCHMLRGLMQGCGSTCTG